MAITYPLTAAAGYDLRELVGKEQWLALVVDLLREQMGEDVSDDDLRAAIVARLDILHSNGLVPRTLPKRFAR